ncbi:MAG: TlpA family protein disulfide reductase [Candidatus Thorarchaeota archaeon]|nr:MAG: TlpA family protein disulfide reductase [Candidatus Thorarchaeota archaeon]
MQTEKMLVLGFMVVLVSIGILIGASFLTFAPAGNGNGGTTTTSATIYEDTYLESLDLHVPDWNFLMSDDELISIQDYEGQFVVVDLMATWCTTCAFQNGNFETLYDNMAGDIEILSLTVDVSETVSMMANYKSTKGLDWPHGLDTNRQFTNYFSVSTIPTIVVIDNEGRFRWMHIGIWSVDDMTQTLSAMMP